VFKNCFKAVKILLRRMSGGQGTGRSKGTFPGLVRSQWTQWKAGSRRAEL